MNYNQVLYFRPSPGAKEKDKARCDQGGRKFSGSKDFTKLQLVYFRRPQALKHWVL